MSEASPPTDGAPTEGPAPGGAPIEARALSDVLTPAAPLTRRTVETVRLRSVQFRRERELTWRRLDKLVTIVEKRGLKGLSAEELQRLPILYRATLSSLSVARSISLDRNVLDYLESLAARAYFALYGTPRTLGAALRDFARSGFPQAVRELRWQLAAATAVMVLALLVSMRMTQADPDKFHLFVDAAYAQGRNPATSTATLRAGLYDYGGSDEDLGVFAAMLWTHNARVALLMFALGFLAGLPVFWLLSNNGFVLGAFTALFASRNLGFELWGWLLPHGVTELLALLIAGAAGLALGQGVVFPGRATRLANLKATGRRVAPLLVGVVIMLFVAGLIEGIFRQRVMDDATRYATALATAVFWILYLTLAGRGRVSRHA